MSIYQQLGLQAVINASGKMTALGASAVHTEVARAISEASMDYVDMQELLTWVGKRIAKATGAEGGCPTLGASAGIAIATAAIIAGSNLSKLEKIPFLQGVPNEVIIQKGHSVHFGGAVPQMMALGGAQVIEVGHANFVEAEHIEGAISEKTVALFYIKSHHAVQKGMQSLQTMLKIGHRHQLPVVVDAAAEEDLRKYVQMGVDLVIYSGGKAIEGPTSGFICGKQHLIEACHAQYKGIGRAMKVGKEALIGLTVALERYANKRDTGEEQKGRMQSFLEQIKDLSGITGRIVQDEAGREIYRAQLTIDPDIAGMTAIELAQKLKEGSPSIYTRDHYANVGIIYIDPRPLLPQQENLIAQRLREILASIRGGK
ncbi:DgaE family pyridoxal phosphate-dependent ammonia lyase [Brevibacillus laterosporus]|uniref:DgaE family pyridoxal phosphate-dependent ammonia lyase n=1 Tax=Brevibacillus halotolerans TaxID=1507437 RepID=A0ABT4HVS8_9BACL|nr:MULTISPECIES: DgaE family pyridoxal phosphate-dependent ammonia lyase [Brevibacillus]MCR8984960.1 DgaE family pyridoxal phosphate-dependent ammonia lyase [Brevibacillus laterosporus]MCZ0830688.1 DgaE family pyridoxal phosphate-dependent ammonia lyase [Brevibacillus halotolerans]GIN99618.1 selenocysteine synthase [Brevibacillus halotolerans]